MVMLVQKGKNGGPHILRSSSICIQVPFHDIDCKADSLRLGGGRQGPGQVELARPPHQHGAHGHLEHGQLVICARLASPRWPLQGLPAPEVQALEHGCLAGLRGRGHRTAEGAVSGAWQGQLCPARLDQSSSPLPQSGEKRERGSRVLSPEGVVSMWGCKQPRFTREAVTKEADRTSCPQQWRS